LSCGLAVLSSHQCFFSRRQYPADLPSMSPALQRSVKAFAVSMPFRSSAGEGRRGEQSGADAFCPRAKAGGGRYEDGGARASSHNFASGEAAGQCGVYGFARVGGRPLPSGVAYEEVVEYPNSATVEEDTSWLDGCFSAAAGT